MVVIKTIDVYFYKESSGNEPVREWLHELSHEDRKIIGRDIRIVQISWPVDNLLVKPLGDKIWEIRSRLDNRISRILFVFHEGSIILLHGFIKKLKKHLHKKLTLQEKE